MQSHGLRPTAAGERGRLELGFSLRGTRPTQQLIVDAGLGRVANLRRHGNGVHLTSGKPSPVWPRVVTVTEATDSPSSGITILRIGVARTT